MNRRKSIITGLAGATAVAALSSTANAAEAKAAPKSDNPELEGVRALLKAHDEAMTGHDMDGVLATFASDGVIIGSGPGELWSGTEEIKGAYENFFKGFDKGAQKFHYNHRFGGLSADMGWLVASGEINAKKDGKEIAFPINISMTVAKSGSDWKIAAMHFSTLTGPGEDEPKK